MDLGLILAGCPEGDAWNALTKPQLRRIAEEVISRTIREFIDNFQEPDDWESSMIANAIGALSMDFLRLAIIDIEKAATPLARRSTVVPVEGYSLNQLVNAFDVARIRSSMLT